MKERERERKKLAASLLHPSSVFLPGDHGCSIAIDRVARTALIVRRLFFDEGSKSEAKRS